MPYAQVHYPFENQEKMEASFPADFIAEYTGQIRAWFYVMHVVGVVISPLLKGGGTECWGISIGNNEENTSSNLQKKHIHL